MNKLISFSFTGIAFLMLASSVFASGTSTCEPIYGGGQDCKNDLKFTINKLVKTPKGDSYVENLTAADNKYKAGSTINFKIKITNNGKRDIENLNMVDTFPQYLTFLAGVGNTNKGASSINFVVGKLQAGKSVEYVISAKAADASSLPQAINCVSNKITATADDGSVATDQAQVCIEKLVEKPVGATIQQKPQVTTIPATGPEITILAGLLGSGAAGFFIRKKIS